MELSGSLASWRLTLEAANLSPRTIRAYTDDGALLARSLAATGMPTVASNIRREHVEAFIAAELDRGRPQQAHDDVIIRLLLNPGLRELAALVATVG